MKQRIIAIIFIVLLLGGDQLSKYFFYNQEIGASFLLLEPLFNTGISRGIAMPFVITVSTSVVCLLLFTYLFWKKFLTLWEFCFFMAGTLGNFTDRIWLNGVRDFISLGSFPVFNFADVFLTIAVILLFIRQIFPCKPAGKL